VLSGAGVSATESVSAPMNMRRPQDTMPLV
jgi:hypothetical protein